MREKPKVGDVLYCFYSSETETHKVTKVGRTYFYTRTDKTAHWDKDEQHDLWSFVNVPHRSSLFYSEEEYNDIRDKDKLRRELTGFFIYPSNVDRLPLASLRKIAELIKEENDAR